MSTIVDIPNAAEVVNQIGTVVPIEAAEVANEMGTVVPIPNEKTAREFVSLKQWIKQ